MARHGIPLPRALEVLGSQANKPWVALILRELASELREGIPLSSALRARSSLFPSHVPDLIFAAEESGSLETILGKVADQLEEDIALRREVLSASLYPCFVTVASVLVGLLVLVFVVPAFRDLFAEFGAELPLVTRMALWLSDAALACTAPAVAFACATVAAGRTRPGRAATARALRRVPVYGTFLARCSLARVTSTLATVLSCGLPLSRALELASRTAGSEEERTELARFSMEVFEGIPLSSLMQASSSFPRFVAALVELGEASGTLDDVLRSVSLTLQAEARDRAAVLKASVEPLLVSLIGLFVGGLMVAVYLPIFGLGALAQ